MRKFSSLSILILSITLLASCTKEGPEGPVGAAGPQGPAGNPGAPGAPGTPGAGITTYSEWFQTGSDWVDASSAFLANWAFVQEAPSVTQSIIDQGVILAYMKGDPLYTTGSPQHNAVHPLPYVSGVAGGWTDIYDFLVVAPGDIFFLYQSDNPWDASDLGTVSFRYVTIPGSVAGRVPLGEDATPTYNGYTKEELKKMSYEQVAELFNIPAEGTNMK